jgi:serine/threonine protein kinase
VSAAPPQAFGDYRVVRTIGRGGMAIVYFAEHQATGERVAIKTIESADASLRSGIRREIHALRRVDHPGVVRIVAEGTSGDLPWYAMELVLGRTLREYNDDLAAEFDGAAVTVVRGERASTPPPARRRFARAANGALPRVLKLLRSVCDALAFVHGMGLVHRDLKPENVMVRDDGSTVLVDFGLAMQLRGARGTDVLEMGDRYIGTPTYMAPEQIDGELMDARVDLYALGCMMYELVTGTVPFVGTLDGVLDQHIRDMPVAPSIRVSDVPPALDTLILALLQKRPRDRIGYADDVAAALSRLGAGDEPPARKAEPHLYRPRLAGRSGALSLVEEKLKNVRTSRGGRVLVGGESGVGKTRFAMEVGISANRRGLGIITGQCISVAAEGADADVKAASLHPLRHLLSTLVDHCRERGLDEAERVFGPRGPALAVHEPSIGLLPGQDRYPRLADLPAAAARARLNSCLAGALAAYAEPQPVVLVIEDLQWADEASMSFLNDLDPAYFTAARVLIVGTYRSEETSDDLRALLHAPDVTRIDLGRLDASAVARMVSDMISMPSPPAAFIQLLVERSEGHPFFVAEYLRMAVRERILVRNDNGEWQIQRLPSDDRALHEALPLPDELQALVRRRVAALGPGALAAARMAAVLGRQIATDVLAAAMKLDDTAHLEALEELRARQIVDLDGGRLRFAHDKLREIIHADIDPDERRRLHASAGAAIEASAANTPEMAGFYPDLVHHFTTARDDEKAFHYLVKAGQAALDATASGEALNLFRRALALADGRVGRGASPLPEIERAELETRVGLAAFNVGLLPEAERLTQAALHRFRGEPVRARATPLGALGALIRELPPHARLLVSPPRRLEDPAARRRATGAMAAAERLAELHFFQHEWVRGLGTALAAVNLAAGLGTSLELIRGYALLGLGLGIAQVPRLGAVYGARAREAAAALGDPRGHGLVSLLAGMSAMMNGRFDEARAAMHLALAPARDAHDTRQIELCTVVLALIEGRAGSPGDTLALYERLGEAAKKSGSSQSQMWALGGQAESALALDRPRDAIDLFERRRILAESYRTDPAEWITHGTIAEAWLALGDPERAGQDARRALVQIENQRVVGFQFYRGYAACGEVFFELWARAATASQREKLARSARSSCRNMERFAARFSVGRPQALRLRGLFEALSGNPVRARRALAESLAEAERLSMPLEQGLAHYELGRRLPERDPARRSHLVDAHAIFSRSGHVLWQERLNHLI